MDPIDWPAFVPAAVVAAVLPGANQLLGLRTAVRRGTTDAAVSLVGRFAAFAVLVAVVAGGFGVLLTRSAVAFEVVRWAGVAYLAYLGVATLRSAGRTQAVVDDGRYGRARLVRREFLVAITNPKALLLFAAFLPQFVGPAGPTTGALVLLGAAYIGIEAVAALGIAVVGGRLGRAKGANGASGGARTRRRLDLVAGTSFLGLAGYLALEHPA